MFNGPVGLLPFFSPFPILLWNEIGAIVGQCFNVSGLSLWPLAKKTLEPDTLGH